MKYGKQGKWKRVVSSPFFLIVILIVFVFLVKAVWKMRERVMTSSERLNTTNAELAKLEDHRSELSNKIKYLSTEQGIEAELRTKYRAIREGESVAVIVNSDESTTTADSYASSSQVIKSDVGWWSRFWKSLGF